MPLSDGAAAGGALVGIDDAVLLAGWATVVWELVGTVPLAGWATGVWVLLQPGRIKRMAMPESKKRRDIGCPRKRENRAHFRFTRCRPVPKLSGQLWSAEPLTEGRYPPKPTEPRLGNLVGCLGSCGPRRRTDQAAPGGFVGFVGDSRASPCGAQRGGETKPNRSRCSAHH